MFWALSFPTMKALGMVQQELLPGSTTWFSASLCMVYRFGIAALVLAAWCGSSLRHVTRSEWSEGAGLGIFAAGGLVLQMDGLAYTSASTSAFLTQAYVLILPLWEAALRRRWPSPATLAGCAMVTAGVTLVADVDWRGFRLGRGEWETLLASVVFTGQILWLQRPRFRHNNVQHFSLLMFLVIAACCLPIAWSTARRPHDLLMAYSRPAIGVLLAVLVIGCTLAAFLLMNYWQPRLTATQAGCIYTAEPVFASLVSTVLPAWCSALVGIHYANETVGWTLLLGGGLITSGNLVLQLQPPASDSQ